MKSKILMGAVALFFACGAMAQNGDCVFYFPQTPGTQLVKKGYDANNNLQGTLTYLVTEVENNETGGTEVDAEYTFADNTGNVIDKGDVEAFCQNGEFFMESLESFSNQFFVSDSETDVASDNSVVNYPTIGTDSVFFDDAYITFYDKGHRKNCRVSGREFVQNEEIVTPSGTYDCAKIKYQLKSRSPKETVEGYGYEWYAPNVGVVKNEQYDNNNQLQYYMILEDVKK